MSDSSAVRTVVTRTVGEGDDAITYDVHGDLATATAERPALFLFGELHARVNQDQVVAVLDQRRVHADFAHSTERDDA